MPADPQFRLLARGALETGARYGELRRLVVGDYNPDSGSLHVRKSKTGRERHIILTMDGRSFFEQLIVGQPKDCPDLRQGLAGVRAYGLHEEGDGGRQTRNADQLPRTAPHLGEPVGDGRNAVDGGRQQPRPRQHEDGREALRPLGSELRCRTGSEVRAAVRHG